MNTVQLKIKTKTKIKAHHHQVKLMGCRFVLTAVDADKQLAWDAIRAGVAEIVRIEDMISSWKEGTFTHAVNINAGIKPVKVPMELLTLIQRSIEVSKLSRGAFDICGTLSRDYWNFNKEENEVLPIEKIRELRELTDYRLIEVNVEEQTVFLQKPGMKIGFGGIGKGYAAFRAKVVMERMGLKSGLINAAGDLMCWGNPPGKTEWDVQIPDPENREQSLLTFTIPDGSVVTSGDYESYTMINGERWSHIIDPRTGWPVKALKCVSIICPNPELGDALATAVTVLGIEDGIALINQLRGIECLIIDKQNNQYLSENLK